MSDRVTAVILLVVVLAFGIQGWSYVSTGFTDVLGARAFPIAIALFMIPTCIVLFLEGHTIREWPGAHALGSIVIAVATLVVFALVIESLGFFVATTGVFLVFGLLLRARWWQALLSGVAGSVVLYALLDRALELYLPVGDLFEGLL